MSEANSSGSEFLLGLEEYLNFTNEPQLAKLIHSVAFTLQKDNTPLGFAKGFLNNLGSVIDAIDLKDLQDLCFNFSKALDSVEFERDAISVYMSALEKKLPGDKIFRGINTIIKNNLESAQVLNDAFSRSQIKSKIWLIDELDMVRKKLPDPVFKQVAVFAGWYGQIKSIYDKILTYRKMRVIEIDKSACEISDYIFNLPQLENHKVKSILANINELTLHKNGYEWTVENFKDGSKYDEKFLPDLIINTSAEHMTEDWFFQIKFKEMESNPIVAIQSNNLFDISEHINCVYSVDHMKKKFPMKQVLYEGELQLKGYKRVMLIGRP